MDRRTFLKGAAAGVGLAALGGPAARAANLALPSLGLEPRRPRTPIDHVVVVMMENRSVDHFLGWYGKENPHFDATQRATYRDSEGARHSTEDWGTSGRKNFHGRGHLDPGHGWGHGRVQLNGGKADGWMLEGSGNDEYALSYYNADDIPVWSQLVREFTTFDRYFCSVLGPTFPNRYYMHSATAGGLKNNDVPPQRAQENPAWAAGWDWPTIWTLCDQAGVTWAYYYSNLPAVALWGPRHAHNARHVSHYYEDAALGRLPQVAFVEPWFTGPEGVANDDHPHADIRLGQEFLHGVVSAFVESSNFLDGALFITYDEWGGFWDHVAPPRLPDDRASSDPNEDFGQLGFRVPTVVISPWTRGGHVDKGVYEHSSILRFISENWGLPYLTRRHAATNSIEAAFAGFDRGRFDPAFDLMPYQAPPELRVEPYVGGETAASDLWQLAEIGWFETWGFRTDWKLEDSFRR